MAYAENLPAEGLMTIDEFLAWDGGGHQGKLILVEGRPVAMSPATPTHGVIQANLSGMIYSHLRRSGWRCRAGTETPVVPPFARNRNVRVPDVAVACTPPSNSKVFEDPILVVEVLTRLPHRGARRGYLRSL